jgi:hypothetical protein
MEKSIIFYSLILNKLERILTNSIANPITIVIMIKEFSGNSGTICGEFSVFPLLAVVLDANGGATLTSTCIRPDWLTSVTPDCGPVPAILIT